MDNMRKSFSDTMRTSDMFNPSTWKHKWTECPPSMIYLILGLASILASIWYGTVGLVGLLLSIFVVAVVYYFLAFLCVKAPVIAWILIILQLLVLWYSMTNSSDTTSNSYKV